MRALRLRAPLQGLAAALLLGLTLLAAQAAGTVPQPRLNPFLAQTDNNQGHWNDAATDSTEVAVPRGHYRVTPGSWDLVPNEAMGIPAYADTVGGREVTWFWAGFSMRKLVREVDARGRGRWLEIDRVGIQPDLPQYRPASAHERLQQAQAVQRLLEAGDERGLLDYLRAQPNRLMSAVEDQVRLGVLYSLITRDHGFVGSMGRGLIRIDQADPQDPYSPMRPPRVVTLPEHLFDDARVKAQTIFPTDTVFGLSMSFNGYLVVNTLGGRIVSIDRNTLQVVDVYRASGADEVFTNSFATSEECDGGALYVASNTTMYRLVVDANGRIHDDPARGAWRARYDRGTRLPLGKITDGTGATPTLMGFGPGEDKLVVITDGARRMRLVAFWRDQPPPGWTPPDGVPDARIAGQVEVDMGPGADVVQSEQSVVVYGTHAFVINNVPSPQARPYLAPGAYYRGLMMGATRAPPAGAAMYRWDARQRRWSHLWSRPELGMLATVPMISGGSRMVIVNGIEGGRLGRLMHLGLDLDSGQTVMSIDSGLDPIFNGSFTGIKCASDGALWYTTMFGLLRMNVQAMERVAR